MKILKIFLGWPITIVSLIFIFKIIAQKSIEILPLIYNINYLNLTLGLFFLITFFFLRGYIWHSLIKDKINITVRESLYLWAMAELKRYTPGNIWSFLGRAFSFEKKGITKKTTALLLFYEAQFFILGAVIASLFSLNFIFETLNIYPLKLNITILIYFLLAVLLALFTFNQNLLKLFKNKLLSSFFIIFPKFSYQQNLKLLFFSTLALFSFGFGSYFSAIAIFNLDIRSFLVDSSFLTFSLLIGYLSIITPMGLGVRELIVILGFSKIIGAENAGVLSVFIRIVLIFSELIFVYLTSRIASTKNNIFSKAYSFLTKRIHILMLFIAMLFYFLYFTIASFLRFDNFYTGKFDLGNMAQTVWNTASGNFFMLTNPNGTEIVSRLSFHADFILIFLTPFYWLWPNPKVLLVIQTAVISFGALFVYLIANHILKNKNISLCFALVYLINPLTQYVNLYDFHAVSFTITFLLAAFYYLLKRKFYVFLIFLILAALTKEQIWLTSGLMTIYFFIQTFNKNVVIKNVKKIRILSIIFTLICFFAFYFLIWIAIPKLSGNSHFALSYYKEFGNSPEQVVKSIIVNPINTLNIVFSEKNITYIYNLLLPLGFLPIFSPPYLIFALPDLIINLLSNNKQLSDIYYQYTSGIIPFLFISSIYGFKFISKKINKNILITYLLITSVASAYFIGPLPFAKNPNTDMFVKQIENRKEISTFLDSIPKNINIAATNNLGAYLSNRESLFVIPVGTKSADMVIFLLNDNFAKPSLSAQAEMAKDFESDHDYKLIKKSKNFVAFEKK